MIVAIDGPAGAGKSTVAGRLATHFGLLNLETGAMYRAFALKAIENGIAPDDAAALEKLDRVGPRLRISVRIVSTINVTEPATPIQPSQG